MRSVSPVSLPAASAAPPPTRELGEAHGQLLTPAALEFLGELHVAFEHRRRELLGRRQGRQAALHAESPLDFLRETAATRESEWAVAPPPPDLVDRRVEITGPPERRMMAHALHSGAQVYMADFEDALSPTWANVLGGQANLRDAARGRLEAPPATDAGLRDGSTRPATLVVRPRGWHLDERHVQVAGHPMSASLFDFGLYAFHNAQARLDAGSGPYYYLPKLESHLEARLWNDVFSWAEGRLRLPADCIRPTVLIETLPAAFEMEEILHELRQRSPALNAGRWDYLFSVIKTLRHRPRFVLPDRADVPMTTPFLWAYAQLLVQTCHRRGAYAIGGMAAYVPSRKDPENNERAFEKVRQDKRREVEDGFDGTWVAHPDLVPVALEVFRDGLGNRPNQLHRLRGKVRVAAGSLLNVEVPSGAVTEAGVRSNIRVSLRYLSSWLAGIGAVAIDSLMEDTATVEIARAQVWHWLRQGVVLEDATTLTPDRIRAMIDEERQKIAREAGAPEPDPRLEQAAGILEELVLAPELAEFLTPTCYERLD